MTEPSWISKLDDAILFKPKMLYFAVSMVFYALYLFRAKFIKNYLGLDDHEYGDVSALMAIVSFGFMALWSSFADWMGRHRLVLIFLMLALAGTFEVFSLVAKFQNDTARFYLSAINLSVFSFFSCGMLPLTDFLTLRMLSGRPGFSRDLYGRQRLWGTISYGLTSQVVGWFLDSFGIPVLFYIIPIVAIVASLILLLIAPSDSPKPLSVLFGSGNKRDDEQHVDKKVEDESKENPSVEVPANEEKKGRKPIVQLLLNPNYSFLLVVVFLIGCGRTVMTTFLSKYLDEKMKLTDKQIGLTANFGIFMEITIFFFGPFFIHNFGTYWMLIFAQVAMVGRSWAYVVLPEDPKSFYWILAVELLKGVAFGFTQLSGVKLASDAAPKGLEATAQAIYTSVYSQAPAVITAFVGGRIYKAYSPHTLFYLTSILSTVALALFVGKYFFDGSIRCCGFSMRKNRNASHLPPMKISSP